MQIYALIDENIPTLKIQKFHAILSSNYPISDELVREYLEKFEVPCDVDIYKESKYWKGVLLDASRRQVNHKSLLEIMTKLSNCYVARVHRSDTASVEAVNYILHLFSLADPALFSEDCSFKYGANEVESHIQNYIRRNNLKRGLLKNMRSVLVSVLYLITLPFVVIKMVCLEGVH